MKSMIYYPGFEVQNEKWLKFALLYFEELRPIIPNMCAHKEEYLSSTAMRIMDETDLISPYRPKYEEGDKASRKACVIIENSVRHEKLFSRFSARRTNFIDEWKNPELQNCKLYRGKFSDVFYNYCIRHRFAKDFSDGIIVSKDLAFVYMSLLADVISEENGIDMFTDVSRYNNILINKDKNEAKQNNRKLEIVKSHLEFFIPSKVKDIPLESIIRLRNNDDFISCRKAYDIELEKYVKAKEDNVDYSFEEQLKINKEIYKILALSVGAVSSVILTGITISSLVKGITAPISAIPTAISHLGTVNRIEEFRQNITSLRSKKKAKRFFGHIKNSLFYKGR